MWKRSLILKSSCINIRKQESLWVLNGNIYPAIFFFFFFSFFLYSQQQINTKRNLPSNMVGKKKMKLFFVFFQVACVKHETDSKLISLEQSDKQNLAHYIQWRELVNVLTSKQTFYYVVAYICLNCVRFESFLKTVFF